MLALKFRLLGMLAISTGACFAQTTEMTGTVELGPKAHVFKVFSIPNCPQSYTPPTGTVTTTIKYETLYTNGKTSIKVESIANPSESININSNKEIRISLSPDSDGKANLYLDDKDKSVLYVNYWLNPSNTLDSATNIEEWYPKYDCSGTPTMTKRTTRVLKTAETFRLYRIKPGSAEMNTTWFKNSERIAVLKPAGIVDYFLVNRYDRNAKYVLELQNREHLRYSSQSLDFGALTIPFKFRPGFKQGEVEVKSDVAASFNLGVYAGYKVTSYSIINKEGTYINRNFAALRVGPFLNLSTTTLDSISTTTGKVPMKKDFKQTIAVLSTGLGIMGDIKGVQLGFYGGWDFGMGNEATNWNYHKRIWWGLGVGYKITDLFAKKD